MLYNGLITMRNRLLKVLFIVCLALVAWTVVWYYGMRAILKSHFKSTGTAGLSGVEFERRYLLSVADCDAMGYDPTPFLDTVRRACYRYGRNVEIDVKISGKDLSLLARPEGKDEQTDWFDGVCFFGEDYEIGKDAVRSGNDTFLFQDIRSAGGYGMGLGVLNTICQATFGEQSLEYSVSETRYWLPCFLIPTIQKDHWNISLPAIPACPNGDNVASNAKDMEMAAKSYSSITNGPIRSDRIMQRKQAADCRLSHIKASLISFPYLLLFVAPILFWDSLRKGRFKPHSVEVVPIYCCLWIMVCALTFCKFNANDIGGNLLLTCVGIAHVVWLCVWVVKSLMHK